MSGNLRVGTAMGFFDRPLRGNDEHYCWKGSSRACICTFLSFPRRRDPTPQNPGTPLPPSTCFRVQWRRVKQTIASGNCICLAATRESTVMRGKHLTERPEYDMIKALLWRELHSFRSVSRLCPCYIGW
ncbi:MAG: hypothetical protein AMXMBFR61_12080 [Fimbriimonadales bacterium]